MTHPKHENKNYSHDKNKEHQGKHAGSKQGSAKEHDKKAKDDDNCSSCK